MATKRLGDVGHLAIDNLTEEAYREICEKLGVDIRAGSIDTDKFKETFRLMLGRELDYWGADFMAFQEGFRSVRKLDNTFMNVSLAYLVNENPVCFNVLPLDGKEGYDTLLTPTRTPPEVLMVILPPREASELANIARSFQTYFRLDKVMNGYIPVLPCQRQ
jgi:hypothetical protein